MESPNPIIDRADRMADLFAPATVVLFAGCGGTCIGIEQAYVDGGYRDKYVDLAINHWDTAVGVHELNHPMTQHLRADVREVDPNSVLLGRQIAYLHASPDCTHFSKARGSKPKKKEIRGLAWVVIDWAKKRRPNVITLENVEEFRQWGPLGRDGQPCRERRGQTFRKWKNALQGLGYRVDERELRAHHYQTGTTRKRLFVVARRDDGKIIFPTHAHWAPADAPVRTAAECIDWSIPMLSIFATPDEAKAWAAHHGVGVPRRPLKAKTLARIAGGLDKFVLKAEKPFLVDIQNYGWASTTTRDVDEPMPTVTAGPKGGGFAAVDVAIAPFHEWYAKTKALGGTWEEWCNLAGVDPTIEAKADVALAPYSIPRYGERDGQAPRCGSVESPIPTITATANGATLVAATLSTLNHGGSEHRAADIREPLHTVTGANDARALVAAMITKHFTGATGSSMSKPLDTVTATDHNAVTCVYLSHFYTSNTRGGEGRIEQPLKTITGGGQHAALTAAKCVPYLVGTGGAAYAAKPKAADEPANTVMVNDRRAIVAAFLAAYYGEGSGLTGHNPGEPLPTVVGRERFALVTVNIDGQTYVVTDIAMRMLTPRELARAQGFADDYVLDRTSDGTPVSKADQVKLIGNSVPPPFARALAYANVVQQGVLGEVPSPKSSNGHRRKRVAASA